MTRKYTIASLEDRSKVNLCDYQDIIQDAVHEVMPEACVLVENDCYYVSPVPSQGEAIRIGRQICKSELSRYCIKIPKLFSSVKIER